MFRVIRFGQYAEGGQARAAAAWRALNTQPSWVVRAAALAFLVVVGVPIVLLLLLAFVAGAMLFVVLLGVNRVLTAFRVGLPKRDGRSNVRVIERREG